MKNGTQWNQCTNKTEYHCLRNFLLTTPEERNSKCPNPCTEITYNTITKSFPLAINQKYATVMMYHTSDYITILEEYLIFDFSSILAAVGGTLGLFIGFSFLQCGDAIITCIQTNVKKVFQ